MLATKTVRPKEKELLNDRMITLKESLLNAEGKLDCERFHYLTESYRETEGEPTVIRRAEFFNKFLSEKTIVIDENPIVGTLTKYPTGVLPYPEYSCEWMNREDEFFTALGMVKLTSEERELMEEAVHYWRDKCIAYKVRKGISQRYPDTKADYYDELIDAQVFFSADGLYVGRINLDYGKVLNRGLDGVISEIDEELIKLQFGDIEAYRKETYLKSMKIACNAVINLARRYALLARDMAGKEESSERKNELERIAGTCEWVPAKPARNFYEAVQSFWFTHLAAQIENATSGRTPGRFAQYMYPFYAKDKKEGRISKEESIELLELLFVKFSGIRRFLSKSLFGINMGNMFQNISLGGVSPTGEDTTNEMDYLLLEAQYRAQLLQPTLSVLYHNELPQEFLMKCIQLVRTGIGMPAFFNNDVTTKRLLNHGVSLEDARNCCIVGCVEASTSHTCSSLQGPAINMPKLLEMALNNGKDPTTGKQLGPETGDPQSFQSYEELHEAIRKQLQYVMPIQWELDNFGVTLKSEFFPVPFSSALLDDCIKNGKDAIGGGSRYSMDGVAPVGVVDLSDSLAAIKKMVFEDKSNNISMKDILLALKDDFQGYEELHRDLLQCPKYGNNDNYVDKIVQEWYDIFCQEHQRYKDHLGRNRIPPALSITWHFPFGQKVGALPSGRKAWLPLTDGTVSPEPGKDKNGPSALVLSAAKVIDTIRYASNLLNMKFHSAALGTREAQQKLLALIKTYMDLGGHHVQFNVIGADTLKDAQIHPENYRSLIVRVAGFSAFFIHLDPLVQNEIIKRTELTLT